MKESEENHKKRENIFQIHKEHTKDIISLLIVFIFGFV